MALHEPEIFAFFIFECDDLGSFDLSEVLPVDNALRKVGATDFRLISILNEKNSTFGGNRFFSNVFVMCSL